MINSTQHSSVKLGAIMEELRSPYPTESRKQRIFQRLKVYKALKRVIGAFIYNF